MWDRPELLTRMANALLAVAFLLLAAASLAAASRLPAFAMGEVSVEGELHHLTREQVEFIVNRDVRGSVFTVEVGAVRRAFEKLPWVRSVEVRRAWPPGLRVRVEEHVALARWGNVALVNTHGELFEGATDRPLPEFVGPQGSAPEIADRYASFQRLLEPLGVHISQVSVSPRRAWQIRLDNGMTLALGREQMEQRLDRFVAVYERSVGVLGGKVGYVDLRYPNGFAVRLPAAAAHGEGRQPGGGEKAKA
jgi:cell division protein FtsQ